MTLSVMITADVFALAILVVPAGFSNVLHCVIVRPKISGGCERLGFMAEASHCKMSETTA